MRNPRCDLKCGADNRGIPLDKQMQYAIHSVYQYFQREKAHGKTLQPLDCVGLRAAEALGISKRTVKKYVQMRKAAEAAALAKEEERMKIFQSITKIVKDQIKQIIFEFCYKRRSFTVNLVLHEIKIRRIEFVGDLDMLRKVLHAIGFDIKSRNGKKYITHHHHVLAQKIQFLNKYMENRESSRPLFPVFLNEVWTSSGGIQNAKKNSQKNTDDSIQTNNGKRFMILHAVGPEELIDGTFFMWKAKKNQPIDEVCHDANETFNKWFVESFLPKLTRPSLIVVGNTCHQNKKAKQLPNAGWKKVDMHKWLEKHCIPYDESMTRAALLKLCRESKQLVRHYLAALVQKIAPQHKILYLPGFHVQYNPIEDVRDLCKRNVLPEVGCDHNYDEMARGRIWTNTLMHVPPHAWRSSCEKIERIIITDYCRYIMSKTGKSLQKASMQHIMKQIQYPAPQPIILPAVVNVSEDCLDPACESLLQDFEMLTDTSFMAPTLDDMSDQLLIVEQEVLTSSPSEVVIDDENNSGGQQSPEPTNRIQSSHLKVRSAPLPKVLTDQTNVPTPIQQENQKVVAQKSILDWLRENDRTIVPTETIEKINVGDLKTLLSETWLTDGIINLYFELIVKHAGPSVYAFNTFFYPKILSQDIQTWTKNVDIFSKRLLFFPIHEGAHWTLCVVNLEEKRICYYNSMLVDNTSCMNNIMDYLKAEHLFRKQKALNVIGWKQMNVKGIPGQQNLFDCGIFICTYAEHLSRRAAFNFSQTDMPTIRLRMIEEILQSSLQRPTCVKRGLVDEKKTGQKKNKIATYA